MTSLLWQRPSPVCSRRSFGRHSETLGVSIAAGLDFVNCDVVIVFNDLMRASMMFVFRQGSTEE